jgi:hypothetical protein
MVKNCDNCGICCRYIVLEIPEPKNKKDFDHIRWLLLHKGVEVYVEKDKSWNVSIDTECINLKDGKCQNYINRPNVCREYTISECERFKKI